MDRRTAGQVRSWPQGLLGAAAVVAAIHLALHLVWPEPFAEERLRRRTAEAVAADRPHVLIAGDSRAELGLDASRLARRLGLPRARVVNIAVPSGDSSSLLAAYREFAVRFAPRPIVLLGVPFFSVSDGACETVTDTLLWSLPLRDRFSIVPADQALSGVLVPEKLLWLRLTEGIRNRFPTKVCKYNGVIPPSVNVRTTRLLENTREVHRERDIWFSMPDIDGVRWATLEKNVRELLERDVQLVVVDMPCHPAFLRTIADTPTADVERRFHDKLADMCAHHDIPLLRYEAEDLENADLDAIFMDMTHLNAAGAAIMTDRVAIDLGRLLADGRVHLPPAHDSTPNRVETIAQVNP